MNYLRTWMLACFCVIVVSGTTAVQAGVLTYNSNTPSNNSTTRQNWLNAIGIAAPQYLEDFESGFSNGQNVSGTGSLFPASMVIIDSSSAGEAVVRSGAGVINGSNPIGVYAMTQNEQPYLELDFTASPVDYVGFYDIDHTGTGVVIHFVGGGTVNTSFETTGGSGNSAEFFGVFRNDQLGITRVQLDSSGDGRWGIDNIEYGVVPEPATLTLLAVGGIGMIRRRKV